MKQVLLIIFAFVLGLSLTACSRELSEEEKFSFKVTIDGKKVQVPNDLSQLKALGYSLRDEAETLMHPAMHGLAKMYLENDNYVKVDLYPKSVETAYKDCDFNTLILSEEHCQGQKISVSGNITFGASFEDVKAVYGEPEKKSVSKQNNIMYVSYEKDGDMYNKMYFKFNEENKLYEIQVWANK